MTVDARRDGTYAFSCDSCPDGIETEQTHFHDALEHIKAEGWRNYKGPDQMWAHSCPACVEAFKKERS